MAPTVAKRQQRLLEEALSVNKPIVLDNTNYSRVSRAPIIALAKEAGAHIVGYYFESVATACSKRNRKREGKACVPDVAIYATLAKLERPSYDEGFDELHYVSIKADRFKIEKWQEEVD